MNRHRFPFRRVLSPLASSGAGAGFFDPAGAIPGSPGAPYTVRVEGPVEISNPVWNAMSLAVGAGIGYALARVTR